MYESEHDGLRAPVNAGLVRHAYGGIVLFGRVAVLGGDLFRCSVFKKVMKKPYFSKVFRA